MMGADTQNMYSDFAVNKYLHTVAFGWIFINTAYVLLYTTSRNFMFKKLKL